MYTGLACLFSILFTAFAEQEINTKRYDEQTNIKNLPRRLLEIMRAYYEDSYNRVRDLNHERWMYEESREYQMGYLMHETIIRYKKIVGSMQQKSNESYSNLHRLAIIQENYFEIYHLVNMMHEIPRKIRSPKTNRVGYIDPKNEAILNAMAEEEAMYIAQEKLRKQRIKQMQSWDGLKKKLNITGDRQQLFDKPAGSKPDPYNKNWPLDYGWEIEDFHLWPATP